MKYCTACMVCREKEVCILPEDDAHRVGNKIRNAGSKTERIEGCGRDGKGQASGEKKLEQR
jgi:hypothetical protein